MRSSRRPLCLLALAGDLFERGLRGRVLLGEQQGGDDLAEGVEGLVELAEEGREGAVIRCFRRGGDAGWWSCRGRFGKACCSPGERSGRFGRS